MKVEYTPAARELDADDRLRRLNGKLVEEAGKYGQDVVAVWDRGRDDDFGPGYVLRATTPDGTFDRAFPVSDLKDPYFSNIHVYRIVGEILRLRTERISAGIQGEG